MTELRPLVSICMACHNAERHLPAALASVFAQTYPNIEVIAVCDSSSDGTASILEEAAREHRLEVIPATVRSAARSRNLAFARSQGEYIKYFDADDLLSPDLIERQVERLAGETDCIASSRWKRFRESPEERAFQPDETWRDLDAMDWLVESFRDGGVYSMMQCGMFLIPRPLIERAGGWDERLTLIDDTEFFARLFTSARRILHTEGALYYRSGMEGSLSGQKSRKAYESAVLALEGFCRSLTGRENSRRVKRTCADVCQTAYFQIAPFEPEVASRLLELVKQHGGSTIRPSGGPVFRAVSRLVGWTLATRLRALAKGVGYTSLAGRVSNLVGSTTGGTKACRQP